MLNPACLIRNVYPVRLMSVATPDPVANLARHPRRYRLLHIKDFKKGFTPTTALMSELPVIRFRRNSVGERAIDYTWILDLLAEIRRVQVKQLPFLHEDVKIVR
jgi:hypothetical protein